MFACAAALAACGTVDSVSNRLVSGITPYKVEVVQGNFVSREQVELLKPGISRQQVRDILGTPLIADLFHAARWDYVFTLKRHGVAPQERRLTVFFKGEALERVEGDPMPSESEFVATLERRRKIDKIPPLEATEEQLKAFPAKAAPATPASPQPAPPPVASYPPLEPPTR
ncbi:MAG TPA: outer membrane protein assembly factor BamE [Ramlibacter sp.]|nr:outer membrane protein assembly factor BamE [Ramlibacter sp.]